MEGQTLLIPFEGDSCVFENSENLYSCVCSDSGDGTTTVSIGGVDEELACGALGRRKPHGGGGGGGGGGGSISSDRSLGGRRGQVPHLVAENLMTQNPVDHKELLQ